MHKVHKRHLLPTEAERESNEPQGTLSMDRGIGDEFAEIETVRKWTTWQYPAMEWCYPKVANRWPVARTYGLR